MTDYIGSIGNLIDTLKNPQGVADTGRDIANNTIRNALEFIYKPQTYRPSWSKTYKNSKYEKENGEKTTSIIPLLNKYGVDIVIYAISSDKDRQMMPNVSRIREDMAKTFGNTGNANNEINRLFNILRESDIPEITQIINTTVNNKTFNDIRKNYDSASGVIKNKFIRAVSDYIPIILQSENNNNESDKQDVVVSKLVGENIINRLANQNNLKIYNPQNQNETNLFENLKNSEFANNENIQNMLKELYNNKGSFSESPSKENREQLGNAVRAFIQEYGK